MIKIQNKLWQWDTDIFIEVDSLCEVHFAAAGSSDAYVVESKLEDGRYLAAIPNILLQECKDIFIYVMRGDDTLESKRVSIVSRPKPDDYVYTETEIKDYTDLENRIAALEQKDYELPVASTSTLGGIKVGQNLTIAGDGTLSAPYAEKGDKGDKGEPGEKGEPGTPGQDGADGYTPQRGVDYWTSADIAEIQDYIDENMPDGGSGSYTLPVATSSTLGGIKVGDNLTITSDGVLSATASSSGGGSGTASAPEPFRYINTYQGGGSATVFNCTTDSTGASFQLKKVLIIPHITSSSISGQYYSAQCKDVNNESLPNTAYQKVPVPKKDYGALINLNSEEKLFEIEIFECNANGSYLSETTNSSKYIYPMIDNDGDESILKYMDRVLLAGTSGSLTGFTALPENNYIDIFGVDA